MNMRLNIARIISKNNLVGEKPQAKKDSVSRGAEQAKSWKTVISTAISGFKIVKASSCTPPRRDTYHGLILESHHMKREFGNGKNLRTRLKIYISVQRTLCMRNQIVAAIPDRTKAHHYYKEGPTCTIRQDCPFVQVCKTAIIYDNSILTYNSVENAQTKSATL